MGRIYIDIEVTNTDDLALASREIITPDQVRHFRLENVLVDTGATTLCLPAEMIRRLGLTRFQEEEVAIATGTAKIRSFESVKLKIGERSTTVDVMELPEGAEPLLGAVPMQRLGIALDVAGEAIQFLKVSKGRGYLRI